uniref:OSJNBa0089E12.22 protein n=1 Tax=Oryza sativa subsp. japonica TaxID=39947 RepID=Q5JQY5_ORYSJ|nr:OSJNBa0089E12.22 [Oryza sativa Japonica Group]
MPMAKLFLGRVLMQSVVANANANANANAKPLAFNWFLPSPDRSSIQARQDGVAMDGDKMQLSSRKTAVKCPGLGWTVWPAISRDPVRAILHGPQENRCQSVKAYGPHVTVIPSPQRPFAMHYVASCLTSDSRRRVDCLRAPTEFLDLSHGDAASHFSTAGMDTRDTLKSFSRAKDTLCMPCIAIALRAPRKSK